MQAVHSAEVRTRPLMALPLPAMILRIVTWELRGKALGLGIA
jgi:hypothetical protein